MAKSTFTQTRILNTLRYFTGGYGYRVINKDELNIYPTSKRVIPCKINRKDDSVELTLPNKKVVSTSDGWFFIKILHILGQEEICNKEVEDA